LIITLNELTTKRSVRLEVEPGHTVRVVVEEVLKTLKIPPTTTYRLVLGGKEIGPELFDKTLGELGIGDGAIMDLVPRPVGGSALPQDKLLRRLSREEEEMRKNGIDFTRNDVWRPLNFPMVYSLGYETLDVAVRYSVNFNARGFILTKKGVVEQLNHTASIYVLRFYPYLDPKAGARAAGGCPCCGEPRKQPSKPVAPATGRSGGRSEEERTQPAPQRKARASGGVGFAVEQTVHSGSGSAFGSAAMSVGALCPVGGGLPGGTRKGQTPLLGHFFRLIWLPASRFGSGQCLQRTG
jgi:hypothetical protein